MVQIGQIAIVSILSHGIFIYLTWRVLLAVNFDPIIRKSRVAEARVLLIFLTIVIGSTVSNFFLDILQWGQDLLYLF